MVSGFDGYNLQYDPVDTVLNLNIVDRCLYEGIFIDLNDYDRSKIISILRRVMAEN